MPKGQNPRTASLAKLNKMTEELDNATSKTMVQKAKTLLKAYTTGVDNNTADSKEVKALRSKIIAREKSLLKNASKLPSRKMP